MRIPRFHLVNMNGLPAGFCQSVVKQAVLDADREWLKSRGHSS